MDNGSTKYEKWKDVKFERNDSKYRYAISNYGRVKSYAIEKEDGRILKMGNINGYSSVAIKLCNDKSKSFYIHKLVAAHFLTEPGCEQRFVLHTDFDKTNNTVFNLKWADQDQITAHNNKNPAVIKRRTTGYKLTESKVKVIKKLLSTNKTRLSMIAKRFGITHTQLNRIRSGENWGHVKAEG